jgi:hypothetical protein
MDERRHRDVAHLADARDQRERAAEVLAGRRVDDLVGLDVP